MMLVPIWRFLSVAYIPFMAILFVLGMALCISSFNSGNVTKRGIFGLGLVGIDALLFVMIFVDMPESLESKARSVMHLPAEAQVIKVDLGDWAGDGSVVFKLPADRPADAWFELIWGMNRTVEPGAVTESELIPQGLRRTETVDEDQRTLEYDQNNRLCTYNVMLGL